MTPLEAAGVCGDLTQKTPVLEIGLEMYCLSHIVQLGVTVAKHCTGIC